MLQYMKTIADYADVCEFNFNGVCHFLRRCKSALVDSFQLILSKAVEYCLQHQHKVIHLVCSCAQVCSAKTLFVSDSANFVAAKIKLPSDF